MARNGGRLANHENSVPRLGWKLRPAYSGHQLSRTDQRRVQKGPPLRGGPLSDLRRESSESVAPAMHSITGVFAFRAGTFCGFERYGFDRLVAGDHIVLQRAVFAWLVFAVSRFPGPRRNGVGREIGGVAAIGLATSGKGQSEGKGKQGYGFGHRAIS